MKYTTTAPDGTKTETRKSQTPFHCAIWVKYDAGHHAGTGWGVLNWIGTSARLQKRLAELESLPANTSYKMSQPTIKVMPAMPLF